MHVMQIGMNTSDMPGSLRFFSEAFGFENAGAQGLWGPLIRIQSLADSDRALIWWLLGRQDTMQLELFHHTSPVQRPLRPDWRPSDHGWVRFGIAVQDFDAAITALDAMGIAPLAPVVTRHGLRRVSVREPYIGCIVEILEDGAGAAWTIPGDPRLPGIVYATSSVADIASARSYYEQTLGMTIEPLDRLHDEADEACWGLSGAQRVGFIAHLGGVRLEIVHYASPPGRPKAADYRNSDQGIVNVGLRADTCEDAVATFDRLAGAGIVPRHRGDGPGTVSGYITDRDREVEIVAMPDAVADIVGFARVTPLLPTMM